MSEKTTQNTFFFDSSFKPILYDLNATGEQLLNNLAPTENCVGAGFIPARWGLNPSETGQPRINMKFLMDMPVSSMLLEVLDVHGHEGVHAHQIGKDRAPDTELLEIARLEDRIVDRSRIRFTRLPIDRSS